MSNPDQNVLKVLGVFFHRPPDRIRIPLPTEIIIRRVLYPIVCSSGIVLSDLQGMQRWQGLGWGGHWDQSL